MNINVACAKIPRSDLESCPASCEGHWFGSAKMLQADATSVKDASSPHLRGSRHHFTFHTALGKGQSSFLPPGQPVIVAVLVRPTFANELRASAPQ
jgi:hypothetical protein